MRATISIAWVFILLTQLDGSPIWVESSAVQIIRPATKQCQTAIGAGIRVGATTLCVRETPEEIERKIKNAK
jgi:hypothetical protein